MVKKNMKIHVAINLLVILAVLFATIINLISTTTALRTTLTDNYLQSNYKYANKIAESIKDLTNDLQKRIVSMSKLASFHNFNQIQLDILYESEKEIFNSLFTTDEYGVIQVISPNSIQFKDGKTVEVGMKIQSDTMKKALSLKKPFISEPYQATSGQLIMLISSPILNDQGDFKGVMAGTIYLENDSVLKRLLDSHRYEDDSYVYAVNKDGYLIYHPDKERINEDVTKNEVVNKVMHGKSGFEQVKNIQNIDYFAGYSYIDTLEWGIISQTPITALNEPLKNLLFKTITQSIFVLILLLILTSLLVKNLTRPLTQLAVYSETALLKKDSMNTNYILDINSHIYEINQLYVQVKSHITMLNKEVQLDGLTGIPNRRTFDKTIIEWIYLKKKFSLIMIDIDKFKLVNDTYGHVVGDDVIKYLSTIISGFAKQDDLSFRYGGEEFGILLSNKDEHDAYHIAEEIRIKVAENISPTGKSITISLGITSDKQTDVHPKSIVERADKALYESKENGRNRTTIYKENYE